jgi:NAD(P)-dependent dehydrogenase (short-subunit alcohol dehydrogenase family)
MAPPALSTIFPPAPTFTDKHLPSLKGKVYIVTGGAGGVGFEVVKMLYLAGGTVYLAARSKERCLGGIDRIKNDTANVSEKKKGALQMMILDLADQTTIRRAAESFLNNETRLDVLIHNAGVMTPPAGSKDKLVRFPISTGRVITDIAIAGPRSRNGNELPGTISFNSSPRTTAHQYCLRPRYGAI